MIHLINLKKAHCMYTNTFLSGLIGVYVWEAVRFGGLGGSWGELGKYFPVIVANEVHWSDREKTVPLDLCYPISAWNSWLQLSCARENGVCGLFYARGS